jgi:undecaprenyl-diphosphatase
VSPLGSAKPTATFKRLTGWQTPVLDATLPVLSHTANYSRIWLTVAAVLGAVGGRRQRRAAVEGVVAVASTSAVADVAVKTFASRTRPTISVPEARRLSQPGSSSFPSGHTASAAAFSGVVGRQLPRLWFPINILAAAVGFSRIYTGVHYPGDVGAGWLLGKGIGHRRPDLGQAHGR